MTMPTQWTNRQNANQSERGTPPDLVGRSAPPHAADEPTRIGRLTQQVNLGELDEAFAELRVAPDLGDAAPAHTRELRDTVAHELTRRAHYLYEEVVPRAVHALGISPLTTPDMALEADNTQHLISERVPSPDAVGETLHTACGKQLWSDMEAPLIPGKRGSWQHPDIYEIKRCIGCLPHAKNLAAAKEKYHDPSMTRSVGAAIGKSVSASTCSVASDRMKDLATRGPVPALGEVERIYHRELTDALAEQARAGGDEVLERIMLRYYANAKKELAEYGYTEPLAVLISDEDWRFAVSNALEDLEEADNGAVAQSYLYGEMRNIIGGRIRQERFKARGDS
jgi:hypothetical protein